ncbi:hypothetical protein [Streptomyces sp. NPDC049949]|uniref:hypothetical protein n=1 Tax=Streptomyces sp. NPDC049949 TaxID=3154627 RepID=UPI003412A692
MTAPPRDRGLGRGVAQLIPQSASTPAEQASAALAALSAVLVGFGALQAVVVLLEDAGQTEGEQLKAAVEATVAHLKEAVKLSRPAPASPESAWLAAPLGLLIGMLRSYSGRSGGRQLIGAGGGVGSPWTAVGPTGVAVCLRRSLWAR